MKKPDVSKLEKLQKENDRELKEMRKRLRSKRELTPFEYAMLTDNSVENAKKTAEKIELKLAELETASSLVVLREKEYIKQYIAAAVGKDPIKFHGDGSWSLRVLMSVTWNDDAPVLDSLERKYEQHKTLTIKTPFTDLQQRSGQVLDIGELMIRERFRTKGLDFFYRLARDVGYQLQDKDLVSEIVEKRNEIPHRVKSLLNELKGLLDELFVDGPKKQYAQDTRGSADGLVARAHQWAEQVQRIKTSCQLYEIDNTESRELFDFAGKWIKLFNI